AEQDEAERRYDNLLEKLLRERGWMLLDERLRYQKGGAWRPISERQYHLTEEEVSLWEKELDSLSHLARQPYPGEAGQRTGFASSFLKAASHWLLQLLHFFSPFKDKPANALDSLAVLNRIGSLALRYQLVPLLKEKDGDNKLSFYQQANDLDLPALRKVNGLAFKPSSLLPSHTLSQLKNKATADLNTLTIWSTALLHEMLFFYSEEAPAEGLAKLLNAFNLLREEIHHLSSELYACRVKAEQAWRQNRQCLQQLDTLDKTLILVEDNLIKLQRDWLKSARDNAPSELFRKGCDCLEVLLSEEMLQLEAVSWAEQTCYYSGLSEDTLKWEMKQRNQQRQISPWFIDDEYRYYHPRHVFT
ncbi:hypothetical protein, partial [Legionella fairfieldensis]|uniref:hypothetical protein n=1 Tax=Legionella fairfieldensis TaxID=45064 RepID=UPI0013EFAC2D